MIGGARVRVADIGGEEIDEPNSGSWSRIALPYGVTVRLLRGEHNRNVFGELGLSEGEIDGYIASGALVSVSIPAAATSQSGEAYDLPEMAHESFVTAMRR
jgi:hypothetical protein